MSKRNIEIKVRLNRKEAEALNKRVKKSRLPARHICVTLSAAWFPRMHRPRTTLTSCGSCTVWETTSTRSLRKLMCWVSLMSAAMMKKCGSSISSSGTSPKL